MTAWPAAQLGAGLFPWVASIWADGSTRYGLWALGILLDVVFSVVNSRRPERFLAEMRGQAHRPAEREERRVRAGRPAGFGLIVALWWLTFQYGLTTVPGAAEPSDGMRSAGDVLPA